PLSLYCCIFPFFMPPPPPRSTLFPYTTLFRSFALAGALTDLNRYGFAEETEAYDPGALSQVKVGDTYWAVPQDTGPVATFYNREVLEGELGLKPPATWEEFRETAGTVSEAGKDLITLDPSDGSYLIAWIMQSGAVWFRPEGDGWIVDMTGEDS